MRSDGLILPQQPRHCGNAHGKEQRTQDPRFHLLALPGLNPAMRERPSLRYPYSEEGSGQQIKQKDPEINRAEELKSAPERGQREIRQALFR